MTSLAEPPVSTHGAVSGAERSYAREKVAHVARFAPGPVLDVNIRLRQEKDPARERPAVAEASLDVDGRPVRSQVAAPTMREAIDLLEARLRRRLAHLANRARSRQLRHRDAGPGEWRHGDPPTHRPEYFDRPPEEREIVRHKTLVLAAESPDEAASDLELLDHDFLLFRNAETAEDNVIHRLPGGGYALIEPSKHVDRLAGCVAPITSSPQVPGRMSLTDATGLLDLSAEPFVFFIDSRTGRGNVVYRRYDGHYGLVAPAADSEVQTR
jgi:ribosome-associated translation inhibitor RaiA